MSYTLDGNADNKRVVLKEALVKYVSDKRVFRIPEAAHAYFCGRLSERHEAGVGHHGVTLRALGIELVKHGEGDAPVERPLQAVVVLRLHEVDVQRETVRVLRRNVQPHAESAG